VFGERGFVSVEELYTDDSGYLEECTDVAFGVAFFDAL
jgi:hypothetical protein